MAVAGREGWDEIGLLRQRLESHDRLIRGTAEAMRALITETDIESALPRALAVLGTTADVDRVYLFEDHPHPETGAPVSSQRAEWAARGVTPQIDHPDLQNFSMVERFPAWWEQLHRAEPVLELVDRLTGEPRRHLEEQAIRSLLLVPVVVAGAPWGFMGFDDCRRERLWTEAELAALRSTAGALGTALVRARAEAELQSANQRLEAIATNTPGAVFQCVISADGRLSFPFISSGGVEALGRDLSVLRDQPALLDSFLHPEDREGFWGSINEAMLGGTAWRWEGRAIDEQGHVHWVSAVGNQTRRGDGSTLWHGLFLDVTAHRESQIALAEKDRRLTAIFENSLDAILLADDQGRYVDVNPAACELLGYPRDELLRLSLVDMFHPEDAVAAQEMWTRFLEAGSMEGEAHLRHKSGAPIIADFRARASILPGLHLSAMRDVTERRQAEAALSDSESRFRLLAQTAPVLIWMTGPDSGLTYVSDQWLAYTGRELADELGDGWLQSVHPDDAESARAVYQHAFATEQPYSMEYRLRRHDGAYRWFIDRGVPRYARDGTLAGYIGSCTDIHGSKEKEQQALEAQREAEEAARLKSALLTNMSHEIRTPLTAIIGFADILAEEVRDQHSELVGHIRMGAGRLLDTLNSVLDFAQLEAGTADIRLDRVELNQLVREAASLLAGPARSKGVELRLDPAAEPVYAHANASAVGRVIANLVSNAVKFTDAGHVEVAVRAWPEWVEIRVSDTGSGISADFLPFLFDAFRQESEGVSRQFEGNGLGLAITKKLLDAMGGSITVDSTKGAGSTFAVRLMRFDDARQTGREAAG